MTQIIYGERFGQQGKIRLAYSAVIFDQKREKVLLTRRAANGQWCLPSRGVEPGESMSDTCIREVWEETRLRVQLERSVGVYNDPNYLVQYADGNCVQVVCT